MNCRRGALRARSVNCRTSDWIRRRQVARALRLVILLPKRALLKERNNGKRQMRRLSWEVKEPRGEGIKIVESTAPLLFSHGVPASAASLFAYELQQGLKGVRTRLKTV